MAPEPYLPEKQLIAAVLRRAIVDYALYKESSDSEKLAMSQEAYEWIWADHERAYVGPEGMNYLYACEALNLDPEYVRQLTAKLDRESVCQLPAEED